MLTDWSSDWSSDNPIFQEKRKQIEIHINTYGLDLVGPGDIFDPKYEEKFIPAVHEGFAKGQKEILTGLIEIEKDRSSLKRSKSSKNRAAERKIIHSLERLNESEAILRKLADTIAWQLIGNQLWLARRLNTDDSSPSLIHSNVESYISFADWFNADNPRGFALISDLTSFVRLGDILARDGDERALHVIELKEGKVNEELLPLAQFAVRTNCEHFIAEVEKKEPPRKFEQFKRLLKQAERLNRTQELIKTGAGHDARGDLVRLSKEVLEERLYEGQLACLIERSKSLNWAIEIVEKCLYLGVYRGPFCDGRAFDLWLREVELDGPASDLRSALFVPLATPMYLFPTLAPHCNDIYSGHIRVLMCLSLSHFAALAEAHEMKVNWVDPKNGTDLNPSHLGHLLSNKEGNVMTLTFDGFAGNVGTGVVARMFYNFTTPTSVLEMLKSNLILSKNSVGVDLPK
ncbi:hypothetical protein [Myxococcus virescens]|uniref:Uncharacterized protein n=1 Tax=Myxococcus virescens TaxID=83456 RepID=A0A511HPB2_9BACT|nr:hypothetical protein [Myxococcus virescens]GEL75431.1 hypothetical protein MVI01_72150 [Myxococcus virescens]SDE88095.1 hypothetical protein SAMN04488504_1149 [Myxococcus virescens]